MALAKGGAPFYSRRMGTAEPVFGNIRNTLGLDPFAMRGREKVAAQRKLFCLAHKFGKIARYATVWKMLKQQKVRVDEIQRLKRMPEKKILERALFNRLVRWLGGIMESALKPEERIQIANDLTQPVYVDSHNSVRSFIIRYPFLVYAVMTLILGWFPWYLGIRPKQIWFVPFLTALIMALVVGGKKGLGDCLRRMVRIRAPWHTWVLVIFLPAVIGIAALGIHALLGGQLPEAALLNLDSATLVQLALLGLLFLLPLGSENLAEFGFRGLGIPALQNKWGSLIGTFILGLFVSLWFLPQFFNENSPQTAMGGLSFLPFFILIEVGWSFMMTWVFNNSRGSSLIAGYVFHSAFNYWTVVLLVSASAVDGKLEFAKTFDATLLRINAVLAALTAIGFIVATKGNLGDEAKGETEG